MTIGRMGLLSRVVGVFVICLDVTATAFALVSDDVWQACGSTMLLTLPLVALVITRSRPGNPVAWVFLLSGLANALNNVGNRIASVATKHHWPNALGHTSAWLTIFWFPGLFLLITLGLLYFPEGRLPGRPWRWVERASVGVMVLWLLPAGVASWSAPTKELINDQVPTVHGWRHVALYLGFAAFFVVLPCVVAAILSLILRWRRGDRILR